MNIEISILLPVYNERQAIWLNLIPLIHRVEELVGDRGFEVLILDNGSRDGTSELIPALRRQTSKVRWLRTETRGRGAALNLGYREARGTVIAVLSIDRAWDESFLVHSLEALHSGVDVVFGQKTNPSSIVSRPRLRQFLSVVSRVFIGIMFFTRPQDTQCIKAFRREAVPFLGLLRNYNYFAETEFFLLCLRSKLRILSLPVVVRDHRRGSKVNLFALWQFVNEAFNFRWGVWVR